EPIKDWSLTSLKDKLIKIGANVVSRGRYVVFQMAEVAIARQMFQEILRLIAELRPQPPPALACDVRCHAFKSNRQKECVQMPGKWPDQILEQAFGLPEVLVAITPPVCLARGRENANIDAGLGFIWRISVGVVLSVAYSHSGWPVAGLRLDDHPDTLAFAADECNLLRAASEAGGMPRFPQG